MSEKPVTRFLGGVSFGSVEVVEVLGFDDVEAGFVKSLEQRDELRVRDGCTFAAVSDEAAAPVVDGERVGESAGISLDAAVGNRLQFEAVAVDLFDESAEFVGNAVERAFPPVEKHVDADEVFFLRRRRAEDRLRVALNNVRGVRYGL